MKILWNLVMPVYCVSPNKYLKKKKRGAQTENGTEEKEKKRKKTKVSSSKPQNDTVCLTKLNKPSSCLFLYS